MVGAPAERAALQVEGALLSRADAAAPDAPRRVRGLAKNDVVEAGKEREKRRTVRVRYRADTFVTRLAETYYGEWHKRLSQLRFTEALSSPFIPKCICHIVTTLLHAMDNGVMHRENWHFILHGTIQIN